MASTPKPTRKSAKVTTRAARTPDGKKVTYQTSKTNKTPVFNSGTKKSDRPIDKKGNFKNDTELASLKGVETNADMKKAVRSGKAPASFAGQGKAKAPAAKYGKTEPSFKKKKA